MNLCPKLTDQDTPADLKAVSLISKILPTFKAEAYIILLVLVYFTCISCSIVFYPFQLLFNLNKWKDPNFRYAFYIFICVVLAIAAPVYFDLNIGFALHLMTSQSYVKIRAIYLLIFVVIVFLLKIHKNTHRMLRGSVRENKNLLFAIFWHSISNMMLTFGYDVIIGVYLGGQYGKPELFFSTLFHIQSCISKKFLPKIFDEPLEYRLPVNRMIVIFAIAYHLCSNHFNEVRCILYFEYVFIFIRILLVALTDDNDNFVNTLKDGLRWVTYQFVHNDADADDTIIMNVPIEHFVILTILLLLESPWKNSIITGVLILVFAFIGPVVIKMFCPKSVQDIIEKRKALAQKKEKKN